MLSGITQRVIIGLLILSGVIALLWIASFPLPKRPPLDRWSTTQHHRCSAMGGSGHLDRAAQTYECFRHPFMRMTKLMFKTTYDPSQSQDLAPY